jgi:hypothetical protein
MASQNPDVLAANNLPNKLLMNGSRQRLPWNGLGWNSRTLLDELRRSGGCDEEVG